MTEEKMEKLFKWWDRMPQSKPRADEITWDTNNKKQEEKTNDK